MYDFNKDIELGILTVDTYSNIINKENINNLFYSTDFFEPVISVVISTFNRRKYLTEMIDSILCQTYKNFEIIIIDDCSSDDTFSYIKNNYIDSRIIIEKNDINSGVGYSKKRGLSLAKGKYLIFCDDDDFFVDKNYFKYIVDKFDDSSYSITLALSYTLYCTSNKYVLNNINVEDGISCYEYLNGFQYKYYKPSIFALAINTTNIDMSLLNNMEMMNDASIFLNVLLNSGNVGVIDKVIGVYRMHDGSITKSLKADFIIENLNEKRNVSKIMSNITFFKDSKSWLSKQTEMTIKYYFNNTKTKFIDRYKIYSWMFNNCILFSVIFKLYIYSLFVLVKRVFRYGVKK